MTRVLRRERFNGIRLEGAETRPFAEYDPLRVHPRNRPRESIPSRAPSKSTSRVETSEPQKEGENPGKGYIHFLRQTVV